MDHSVRIAEEIYYNDKEAKQFDHSQIIKDVLELNDWEAELKEGVEEEIEKEIAEGIIELIDPKPVAAYDDFDSIEGKKEKKKIGKMEIIFSKNETQLVQKHFQSYIDTKVQNPDAKITAGEIKERYYCQMKGLPKKSPYLVLEKYTSNRIVTKVRTLITQAKHRKTNAEKKEKSYSDARIDNPKL